MSKKEINTLLTVSIVAFILATVGLLLLALFVPAQAALLSVLVGSLLAAGVIACVSALIMQIDAYLKKRGDLNERVYVPDRHVGIVYAGSRRLRITYDPILAFRPTKGEKFKLYDLRQMFLPKRHTVETHDRAHIEIQGSTVWQISNIERFLDHSIDPEKQVPQIIESVTRAALVREFGLRGYRELIDSLDDIANAAVLRMHQYLRFYGVLVSGMQISHLALVTTTKAEQEAERLRALDLAVSEIGGLYGLSTWKACQPFRHWHKSQNGRRQVVHCAK